MANKNGDRPKKFPQISKRKISVTVTQRSRKPSAQKPCGFKSCIFRHRRPCSSNVRAAPYGGYDAGYGQGRRKQRACLRGKSLTYKPDRQEVYGTRSDDELIILKLPTEWPYVNLYFIGDKHIGSQQSRPDLFRRQVSMIESDPYGMAFICGDLLDFGVMGSKTVPYCQRLSPQEQKDEVTEILEPITDKIGVIVPGNHENRGFKMIGINPLYDIACRLRIEDRYRENAAAVKVLVGALGTGGQPRQVMYGGVVSHGSSLTKHQKFTESWDGADFFVSGHTHRPGYKPEGKRRLDLIHEKVVRTGYKVIVVDPGMDDGGYALRDEYAPTPPPEIQTLTLYGGRRHMRFVSEEYGVT